MVQSGSVDSGSTIYHDITDERWKKSKNVKVMAITPLQYVLSTTLSTSTRV